MSLRLVLSIASGALLLGLAAFSSFVTGSEERSFVETQGPNKSKCCSCVYLCPDGSRFIIPALDPPSPNSRPCQGASECADLDCPLLWTHPEKGLCELSQNSKDARCRFSPYCLRVPPE